MSEMAKDAEAKPMSDEEYARKVQSDEDAKSAGATAASADAADEGPNIDLAAIGLGSNTKPKHAGEGAWRLLKSVGVGVAGGAAALVAAPALGAKEGGAKGFAQGLGMGIAAAIALPITGVVVGLKEFGDGVAATPAAVEAANENKEWDPDTGKWIVYDLAAEKDAVLSADLGELFGDARRKMREASGGGEGKDGGDEKKSSGKTVKDGKYTLDRRSLVLVPFRARSALGGEALFPAGDRR